MEASANSNLERLPDAEPRRSSEVGKPTPKCTPTRPVYDDFETAFSSITSGSGKCREDQRKDVSVQQTFHSTPNPHARELLELDPDEAGLGSSPAQPAEIDLSFGSKLSGRRKKLNAASVWPRNSFELIDISGRVRRQREATNSLTENCEQPVRNGAHFEDKAASDLDPPHMDESSSLRDSTLEKIIRKYEATESRLTQASPDQEGCGRETVPTKAFGVSGPFLNLPGLAPNGKLPGVPSTYDHISTHTPSDIIEQTSSYGDTRNLLGIMSPESSNTDSRARTDPLTRQAFQSHNGDRNPFRRGSHTNYFPPRQAAVGFAAQALPRETEHLVNHSNETEVKSHTAKLKCGLERDISRELRRVSVLSNASMMNFSQECGNGGFQSTTDSVGPFEYTGIGGEPVLKVASSPKKGFYDQSAIPQTWLGSQQLSRVRVPIKRHAKNDSSKSAVKQHSVWDGIELENLEAKEDGNDWETVGEDGAINEGLNRCDMLGGFINRATSSIANESDDGSESLFHYDQKDFSSTERIATHEGAVGYSNDYRFRDPGLGGVPVLLPSTRALTPRNGEPINSSRNISLYTPLHTKHNNPFRTRRPLSHQETLLDVIRPDQVKLRAKYVRTSGSWMNDFADPGPAVKRSLPNVTNTAPDFSREVRPNSYQYVSDLCLRREVSETSAAGSEETTNSTSPLANRGPRYLMESLPVPPPRAQLVSGPEGRFYREVVEGPHAYEETRRAEAAMRELATYERRSMSLVNIFEEEEGPYFLHQAPRPVPTEEWIPLYTGEQLDRFRARASGDNQGSPRRIPGPRLTKRHASGRSNEAEHEKYVRSLSTKLLVLCAILPPLFILYGEGYMDRVAKWITGGEVRHLSESHKQLAFWLGLITGILVMIAMGLAIGFAIARPSY
jgi:hypothetical protein